MFEPESITEQYLADLDDLGGASSDDEDENKDKQDGNDAMSDVDEDAEFDEGGAAAAAMPSEISTMFSAEKFTALMAKIESRMQLKVSPDEASEQRKEDYAVVVQCNDFLNELDNEIVAISKVVKDLYATKFPELESLILNPLDYARVVKRIGNEMDVTSVDLTGLLPSATIMVISVTASSTTGKPLSTETLERVMNACDQLLDLDAAKGKMLHYIETRMVVIAPNLTNVVGSSIAAQLMVQAGGLQQLARMPASNIQLLGSKRRNLNGLSLASANPGAGFLHSAELTSKTPLPYKRKCVKLLAAKIALVARVDSRGEDPTGGVGRHFRDLAERHLEKLQEPPPAKQTKALPAPEDKPRKRRGGARVRKLKEKLATTELQRQANRIAFGVPEDEVLGTNRTKGLGMIGKQQQSGKVRLSAKEQKIRLSEKAKQRRGLTAASSGATGGISSTVAMTATTGMIFEEMHTDGTGTVTPARLMPVKKENLKYFSGSTLTDLKK